MTDNEREMPRAGSDGEQQGDLAPELYNDEQEDESTQTQDVAGAALAGAARDPSPLDSLKDDNPGELMDDSTQDLIDHMRDMEQSGRIDMSAYRGEPNHDDNEDRYGLENKLDGELTGDDAYVTETSGLEDEDEDDVPIDE